MNEQLGNTLRDRQALLAMGETSGWQVLTDEFSRRLAELTGTLLDPKTPKDEAEILRQTRARLKEEFSPQAIHSTLLRKMDLIAERESARQPKPESPPNP